MLKSKKKVKRKKTKREKITFDEEIITKDVGQQIINKLKTENDIERKNEDSQEDKSVVGIPKKRRKLKNNKINSKISEKFTDNKNLEEEDDQVQDQNKNEDDDENDISKTSVPQDVLKKDQPSKRSIKKEKYAKLLQEKHLKSEITNTQRSLNYLSLWKHSRSEWKFEKLRQVWILQNMYNINKVPDEFFDIVVEYFTNSKGKVKDMIIEKAVKIIEDDQTGSTEAEDDENKEKKLHRARTIVQNLS